jgi:hypothetical protein
VTFRPRADQTVVVVAATDLDAVEAFLRPQLGTRLCVVRSRWTRPQLDAVRGYLGDRRDELAIDTISEHVDERAQPSIQVQFVRVTKDLADWATSLPVGTLELKPSLTPAPV